MPSTPWWTRAVFYEIYVRSFQDSNGDGIGDLNGITARLSYLSALGVDAIWITPFYPSPQVDFGYDISNHEEVDPQFGTLADFDRLVAAAHQAGIKIVIDLVLNHTSDRHPRFEASRSSRTSPYRDWYIWRDGRHEGQPPNNWESTFGGSSWTYDPQTTQWFYHSFYAEQPDLNWRNPAVEAWMFETVRFWIERGVDGFRLDAVNTLFEDPELRDNPPLAEPRVKLTGVVSQEPLHTRGLSETHDVLRRLRQYVDRHTSDGLLISEAYVDSAADLIRFYGRDGAPAVHLPFNFLLAQTPERQADAFRRVVEETERAFGRHWPSVVLNNHDIDRAGDRYAEGASPDAVGRLLAVMLLTLRGTPFLYYGEEIGMRTQPPERIEEVRDPVGRYYWPRYKGRDGVRRPMQWDASAGAGFTSGTPWLDVAADAGTHNVTAQDTDTSSILALYRCLIRHRRAHAALRDGGYRSIASGPDVFAYVRVHDDEIVLVVLNCADEARDAKLELDDHRASTWQLLASTHACSGQLIPTAALRLAQLEGIVLSATPVAP